jgi:hypothetical protein
MSGLILLLFIGCGNLCQDRMRTHYIGGTVLTCDSRATGSVEVVGGTVVLVCTCPRDTP